MTGDVWASAAAKYVGLDGGPRAADSGAAGKRGAWSGRNAGAGAVTGVVVEAQGLQERIIRTTASDERSNKRCKDVQPKSNEASWPFEIRGEV